MAIPFIALFSVAQNKSNFAEKRVIGVRNYVKKTRTNDEFVISHKFPLLPLSQVIELGSISNRANIRLSSGVNELGSVLAIPNLVNRRRCKKDRNILSSQIDVRIDSGYAPENRKNYDGPVRQAQANCREPHPLG